MKYKKLINLRKKLENIQRIAKKQFRNRDKMAPTVRDSVVEAYHRNTLCLELVNERIKWLKAVRVYRNSEHFTI